MIAMSDQQNTPNDDSTRDTDEAPDTDENSAQQQADRPNREKPTQEGDTEGDG